MVALLLSVKNRFYRRKQKADKEFEAIPLEKVVDMVLKVRFC